MEYWDIYNRNREKLGKTIVRGEKLEEGEYHLVVHMWILNSKGEFLIQKRASTVKSSPNIWAITGGAAIAGDDSYSACLREVQEEIGIKVDMEQAKVAFTVTRKESICDVWLIKQDIDLKECVLQIEEVSEVRWASVEVIKTLISQGLFHRYFYLEDILEHVIN